MDQSIALQPAHRNREVESLSRFVAAAIARGRVGEAPFHHLVFDRVFPDDVYDRMLAAMPETADYRPMSGRSKGLDLADGTRTRVKIDLFPEYIRTLPPLKRAIWDVVGRALCSRAVMHSVIGGVAPSLQRRFGANFADVRMYPLPVLTRDVPGYRIPPHSDSRWKGITVQLYLPRDDNISHIGTIFHERMSDGSLPKRVQMAFLPNTGYAFAVTDDSWHSADTVGPEVKTRDSILLTYFVDSGILRFLRNRGKRLGNFLCHEMF
jgi:hypothetical protein